MKKKFHIGTILSVTHDKLMSPKKMGGVYNILNFMTGESLFTHALPRAADTCKPSILSLYPQLKKWKSDEVNKENYKEKLKQAIKMFGEYLFVEPLSHYKHKNPVEEVVDMGAKNIVVIGKEKE